MATAAANPNKKRKRMGAWMGSLIPEGLADPIFAWSSFIFLVSLAFGVVTSILIFASANVKEQISNRAIAEALKTAGEANERAGLANERAAEATLKLEELRAKLRPRTLRRDSFFKLLEGKPKAPVEIVYPKDDAEAYELSMQLRDFLRMAEWDVKEPSFIPQTDVARFMNAPSAVGAGGQPTGVSLVVRAETQDDFKILGDMTADTPFNALHGALLASLGRVSGAINNDASPARGVIRVVVGPKPHTIQ